MESNASSFAPRALRVLSFNILADCWVNADWYRGVPLECLDREARFALILRAVRESACSVACLQEVMEDELTRLAHALQTTYWATPLSANCPTSASAANGTAMLVHRDVLPQECCSVEVFHLWLLEPRVPCMLVLSPVHA